ncbi:hypothetical protein ACIRBZ_18960 [Streptomyces sp. NPDC094038]|uniref:hypothetical protein n=1 Tax=Streptomyces sp. NPDC094038 TaxID=3366055 RepID=UPI00381FA77B
MLRRSTAALPTLAGVTATPAGATPALVPAADREVVFTADGTTVYGTLHVPEHRPLFEAFQGSGARFVSSDDAVYPPDTAAALRPGTKVLLRCGTNDAQVPCATTNALTNALTTALTTALRHGHAGGPGRVTLPGVDHLLHDTAHPNTLAPPVLDALHRFARH